MCRSNFKNILEHVTTASTSHSKWMSVNSGDMMGSGTISGSKKDSYGSMLELTWKGENPLKLNDGTERKFIQDYDTADY